MKCKSIQELLKSDYLDGELNPQQLKMIDEHLKGCSQCHKLAEELKIQHMFFEKSKREKVPAHIWDNIRNAIITENFNKETVIRPAVLERLRELIWGRKPVFVLASTFALILFITVATGVLVHKRQSLTNGEDVFADYNLSSENGDFVYGFGTDIEEYFL